MTPEAVAAAKALESDRHACIMEAALELVAEVGYERMTMDAVAARAKASKATIYRRWDSKASLVGDAMTCRPHDEPSAPDTGELRTDLLLGMRSLVEDFRSKDLGLFVGLLSAIQRDEELASVLRSQVFTGKREAAQLWGAAAIARGEIDAHADLQLAHETAIGLVFVRLVVLGEPIDDAFVEHVVDALLIPLLTRN